MCGVAVGWKIFLHDMHSRLVAHFPWRAGHQIGEPILQRELDLQRGVGRVEIEHIDIHRQVRRHDAMEMVPDAIAHEACGDTPVRQAERPRRTELFHTHRVLGDDVGYQGHGFILAKSDGDNAELPLRIAL